MSSIRRRQFLLLSAGTMGIVFSRQCSPSSLPQQVNAKPVPNASFNTQTKTVDGLIETTLEARSEIVSLGQQQGELMTYNGQIPGPRLEAKPGDTVRIHFTNKLSQSTNVHYHGLHISPQDKADNIFLSVPPNETHTYEFTLPSDHPAGTFYYHPHVHEQVAQQVFAGLGGIFVVRGALDEIPEVRAAQEEFLFLKDFALNPNGEIPQFGHMDLMNGREGSILTVNGQIQPTFSISKNGLLRLRIVNGSASRFYRLSLEEHPFYLIATDSGAIDQPIELQELILSPGERAEILVQGNRPPGRYRLLNLPYDRGIGMGMGNMGNMNTGNTGNMSGGMGNMNMGNTENMSGSMGNMEDMNHQGSHPSSDRSNDSQVLATLTYRNSLPQPLPLPKKLIPVETLGQPIRTRRIEMSMTMGMGEMAFLFNNQSFDMNRVDITAQLGTIEDWDLVNLDPDGMEHSFHLHTYPFQVISRNGQPDPYSAWQDTLRVRAQETVRIRIPFRDFVGKTVYHCHVLDHEDLGMMGILEVKA
jgi:FtsP/CotA-like multicopper oxidase with cupredoxin domain